MATSREKKINSNWNKKPFDNLEYPECNPIKMRDIIDVGTEVYTPNYVKKRLEGNYRDKPIITDLDGIAPTCVAHYASIVLLD